MSSHTLPDDASAGRPSMADVARIAGVSGQTVSRVATGSDNVSPETRRRVLAAMEAVGYTPNAAARALRRGSFNTIGVIARKLARTGPARTVEAVVRAARAAGHTVALLDIESAHNDDVERAASRLSDQAIDGLIIVHAEIEDAERLSLPPGLPVVASDATFGGRLPMVGTDHAGGARAAVNHLLDLGHHTVHHVAGPVDSIPARARLEAWRETLQARGIEPPEPLRGDWTAQSGYAAGERLASSADVTAVFCGNDEMATGLMLAWQRRGRRIPDDLAVVGFDDIPVAAYLMPPLTTVHQPFARVGRRLVTRLLGMIGDEAADQGGSELVPCELVVRESTAPPPGD